nr:hypothetical protein [Gloeocapsa sp. UFS-A4-WI-NPMV-4B04]
STVPDSTTGEIHENSLRCIPTQYAQGIIFDILLAFTLNRTVLYAKAQPNRVKAVLQCLLLDQLCELNVTRILSVYDRLNAENSGQSKS